jgi:hypothetical protein
VRNNVLVIKKTFEIRVWKPRICKNFEITRTIYSSSESSEEFLVAECFTIKIKIGKKYWDLETCRKS